LIQAKEPALAALLGEERLTTMVQSTATLADMQVRRNAAVAKRRRGVFERQLANAIKQAARGL